MERNRSKSIDGSPRELKCSEYRGSRELCIAAQTRSVRPQCKFAPGWSSLCAQRTPNHLLLCSILSESFRRPTMDSHRRSWTRCRLSFSPFLFFRFLRLNFPFVYSLSTVDLFDGCFMVHAFEESLDLSGFHRKSIYIQLIIKIERRIRWHENAWKGIQRIYSFRLSDYATTCKRINATLFFFLVTNFYTFRRVI